MTEIRDFLDQYGLHTDPQTRYIDFMSDAGELGKAVLHSTDYGTRPLTATEEMKDKGGDCLFSLLAMLEESGIDPDDLIHEVLARYRRRMEEYPGNQ